MAMISINGMALPNPASYKVTLSDLDSENTKRNYDGGMLRDRVRAGVYNIEASWTVFFNDYDAIIAALSPAKITVNFFDPNTGGQKTATMYAGDRSGDLVSYTDESRPETSVWALSCTLVEY